ncbi:DUF2920 family protein [Campylobacter sp.]|uniref:DUF2920 family protein n=1 Tax=Campylobacter sp. TaxID=205 RepID=UPI0026DC5F07|nr:DUF2920 family protein [Campylobacter sp.]MDO4674869.1 DUF2920 family protein [Campylobacter sp.]
MIIHKSYKIKSCDDVELGLPRSSEKNPKLEFKLCWDDSRPVELLLVIIQGLGDDIFNPYLKLVMESLAKKHRAAILSPNYHNIGNRNQCGAKIDLDAFDMNLIEFFCKSNNISLPPDFRTSEYRRNAIFILQDFIKKQKQSGLCDSDFQLAVSATFFSARGEYQNFGVMPALDVLNALLWVQKNPPFKVEGGVESHEAEIPAVPPRVSSSSGAAASSSTASCAVSKPSPQNPRMSNSRTANPSAKSLPVIAAGESYGGYLASMCAKIAPWAVDGVINNSGGAKFIERMIGFGKEINYKMYPCTHHSFDHILLSLFDKTYWTTNPHSPYFFSNARRKIRYILEPRHLEIQAAYPKPIYVGYHSAKDYELPLKECVELYKIYQKLGFDATLHAVRYKKQIDGKFIKTLDHGLGIPFKALINKHLPEILEKLRRRHASPQNPRMSNSSPAENSPALAAARVSSRVSQARPAAKNSAANPPLLIPRSQNKSIAYPCDELLYTFSEKNHKMRLEISRI